MKIAFALMVHRTDDERVAFQEAASLRDCGDKVDIFSVADKEMNREEKMRWMRERLSSSDYDVIICDTPIAVNVACQVRNKNRGTSIKTKVIYDITEWYPSKKNLRGHSFVQTIIRFISLSLLSLVAGCRTDGFIFGEHYKSFPFRYLFFWKPMSVISYYAPLNKIKMIPMKESLQSNCTFYYSGNLTSEKGFNRVVSVVQQVALKRPSTQFVLKIVSSQVPNVRTTVPNLTTEHLNWMPFDAFCDTLGEGDIFFDLRDNDIENTHCLPIKLFYYMAAGRPMIYSNLKAIRKSIPEFNTIGCLVEPDKEEDIVNLLLSYIDNPKIYRNQCQNSINLSLLKYNWEAIKNDFLNFVHHGV